MKCRWFEADKDGLEQQLARRGKAFVVLELIQNAWDADGTTRVVVDLVPEPRGRRATLVVTDDSPDGFRDLTHSYTFFAPSEKKGNPEKRGRFNAGEKFVLACCVEAEVVSTTGHVIFSADGTRKNGKRRRDRGSVISALVKLTRAEVKEIEERFFQLLPPDGINTVFNGKELLHRKPIHTFSVQLPTEIADSEGSLRPTKRITTVEIYEPLDGETPSLYELGLPVVETGDRWHINVLQKVPLNTDRDNVTPSYLRKLRVHVLNEMVDNIDQHDATTWCRDAVADKDASQEAVTKSLDLRFGKKRVIYDPKDPEANKLAVSKGYTVIHGRSLSKEEWANVKQHDAARPAGQVTPSPKAYSDDPNASIAMVIPEEEWTVAQKFVAEYVGELGFRLLDGVSVGVVFVKTSNRFDAAFVGNRRETSIHFNLKRLGNKFFDEIYAGNLTAIDSLHSLLIHELGHFYSTDHLSAEYHRALCDLGARLVRIRLDREPHIGEVFGDE